MTTVLKMKRKVEQQPKLKLYYFDIKGKGEAIRLLCAFAGLELEDYRFGSRDEFNTLKADGTLAFGQVPLLEVDGTHKLVQSAAILRYLGKLSGLYPEDPLVAAKVDAILDQETDAFSGVTVCTYSTRFGIELDDSAKEKSYETISKEVLPRHLGNLEKLLEASSTGWLADTEEPSPADFAWYCRLADALPTKSELSDSIKKMDGYPACKAFVEKMKSLDEIKEYYAKK